MDNLWFVTLVFWPLAVLLSAGANMAISGAFSWSELIFDFVAGVLAGYFLFEGTRPDPDGVFSFFLVFSHGLPGLLWATSSGFRDAFGEPATFFWALAGFRLGATIWAAAWDYASAAIGAKLDWGPAFFSVVVLPAKLPCSLITTGVGLLIWIAGVIWAIAGTGKAGFAGGVLFTEFSPGGSDYYATTVGATVQTWLGDCPFAHELYHTRQYIYLADWMIPLWCLGVIWGLISAAISSSHSVSSDLAFGADQTDEVGNPLEVAAYHRYG